MSEFPKVTTEGERPPGWGARSLDDILNPPPPPAKLAFDAQVDRIIQIRGLPRPEAERAAYGVVLTKFLNATHPDTDPTRCAHCGEKETPNEALLPIGWGARHSWPHDRCWPTWRKRRRAAAEEELARLGVVKP
jgi:hypothetical protein